MTRSDVVPLPREVADPKPFAEPWQAQVFGLVVELHRKGVFTWNEWADSLSRQLARPDTAADGSDYYDCWLKALEDLLGSTSIAPSGEVDTLQQAWHRAAHATPHGQPILLENDPQLTSD